MRLTPIPNPEREVVVIGQRSNLTSSLSCRVNALILPASQLRELQTSTTLPLALPVIINAFRTASRLSEVGDPQAYVEECLSSLARSLALAERIRSTKIFYTSSAVVYGENSNCRETDPLHGIGLHAAFKVAAEELVRSFASQKGIDFTIARLFNLFGGNDRFSVVHQLQRATLSGTSFRLANDGTSQRDFTYVHDAAAIYLHLLKHQDVGVINVGTGKPTRISDLVAIARLATPSLSVEAVARQEVTSCVANITKLHGLLGDIDFVNAKTYLGEQLA